METKKKRIEELVGILNEASGAVLSGAGRENVKL